jgi:hypothetical protein
MPHVAFPPTFARSNASRGVPTYIICTQWCLMWFSDLHSHPVMPHVVFRYYLHRVMPQMVFRPTFVPSRVSYLCEWRHTQTSELQMPHVVTWAYVWLGIDSLLSTAYASSPDEIIFARRISCRLSAGKVSLSSTNQKWGVSTNVSELPSINFIKIC